MTVFATAPPSPWPALPSAPARIRTARRLTAVPQREPVAKTCDHRLGGLPCVNDRPHRGHGCVHLSTSGVPDRHDYGDDE